jgi:mono/diheme cytochrome c family protein
MIKKNTSNLQALSPLLVCMVTLLLSGCGGTQTIKGQEKSLVQETVTADNNKVIFPDSPPSVPDGKVVWQKLNCASCHGTDGKGLSGKISPDLSDKYHMVKQTPADQYRFLVFGKSGVSHLTVNKLISRREAWNLVFYVRSLARPPATPEQVMAVDAVFGSNCAVCHGKKGYGDGPIGKHLEPLPANFQNFERFYDRSDFTLYDHIANGIKWEGMPNFLGKEDKAKNIKFDQAYIWKLVDYVRHFQETTDSTATAPGT